MIKPRYTNKHFLKCTFSKSLTHRWANIKESYNRDMKVQVTAKDVKKEDSLFIIFSTPEA